MPANPTPWLVVIGIVIFTLYIKGYFTRKPTVVSTPTIPPVYPQPVATPAPVAPAPSNVPLEYLDAKTLGLAFAKASKREGEEAMLQTLAAHYHATNQGIFSAPFAVPAPAPPAPPAAGSQP